MDENSNIFNIRNNNKKNKKRRNKKKFFFQPKIVNFQTSDHLTKFQIPFFLQHSLLSGLGGSIIEELRPWQQELFSMNEWIDGTNSLIVVPTSGGKTLVADVAIAQILNTFPRSKCLYSLPFVSLANEKYLEYRERFFQHKVRAFYSNIGGYEFVRGNIGICTYEKTHSLINSAIKSDFITDIQLVIIDEVHMINDNHRGPVIESLIVKLLLMKHNPRIILLTATINNEDAQKLSRWINGFLYSYYIRSVPIKFFIKDLNGTLFSIINNQTKSLFELNTIKEDKDHLLPIIRSQFVKNLDSLIIIFVNTRAETRNLALFISKYFYDSKVPCPLPINPNNDLLNSRKQLIQQIYTNTGFIDESIYSCIINGIMYHNAGLLLEDRRLIEKSARNNILNVIIATTTLSAGINLHGVSRVIIHNIYRFFDNKKLKISESQFIQMVGRCGRNKKAGEAYIIQRSSTTEELNEIIELTKGNIPSIKSFLHESNYLDRFFLQTLSSKLTDSTETFLKKCLYYFENDINLDNYSQELFNRLFEKKLIDNLKNITPLGLAISGSSLSIEEGILIDELLSKASHSICLDDDLHLLYLCVSPQIFEKIQPISYDNYPWTVIIPKYNFLINLITNLSIEKINHLYLLPFKYGSTGRIQPEYDDLLHKILISYFLHEIINEKSLKELSKLYSIEIGEIQSIQTDSASYCAQICKFCELSNREFLAASLSKLKQRLSFAARSDLLSLMTIPSINRTLARNLINCGISSPIELSKLTTNQLSALINTENMNLCSKIIEESQL